MYFARTSAFFRLRCAAISLRDIYEADDMPSSSCSTASITAWCHGDAHPTNKVMMKKTP